MHSTSTYQYTRRRAPKHEDTRKRKVDMFRNRTSHCQESRSVFNWSLRERWVGIRVGGFQKKGSHHATTNWLRRRRPRNKHLRNWGNFSYSCFADTSWLRDPNNEFEDVVSNRAARKPAKTTWPPPIISYFIVIPSSLKRTQYLALSDHS